MKHRLIIVFAILISILIFGCATTPVPLTKSEQDFLNKIERRKGEESRLVAHKFLHKANKFRKNDKYSDAELHAYLDRYAQEYPYETKKVRDFFFAREKRRSTAKRSESTDLSTDKSSTQSQGFFSKSWAKVRNVLPSKKDKKTASEEPSTDKAKKTSTAKSKKASVDTSKTDSTDKASKESQGFFSKSWSKVRNILPSKKDSKKEPAEPSKDTPKTTSTAKQEKASVDTSKTASIDKTKKISTAKSTAPSKDRPEVVSTDTSTEPSNDKPVVDSSDKSVSPSRDRTKIASIDKSTESSTTKPSHQSARFSYRRWAVIIGISSYQDSRIPKLRYASADARAFYQWIVSKEGTYSPSQVKVLVNKYATGINIKDALFNWLGQALEEDVVTIYFAGHGSPQSPDYPDNLFLLPYDTDFSNIASTGFPMWDIETALRRFIKSRRVIVIADACHSGGVGQSFDVARRSNRGVKVNRISTKLNDLSKIGKGICVISAAGDRQFSQESRKWGGGHGVFTYYLLEGLNGKADYNRNNSVSLGEIIPYLSEHVRRATSNAQSPTVAGKFDPMLTIGR
jgi:uncharacterized caspase-like protein